MMSRFARDWVPGRPKPNHNIAQKATDQKGDNHSDHQHDIVHVGYSFHHRRRRWLKAYLPRMRDRSQSRTNDQHPPNKTTF